MAHYNDSIHRRGASKCATLHTLDVAGSQLADSTICPAPVQCMSKGPPGSTRRASDPSRLALPYLSTYLSCPWKMAHRDVPGLVLIGGEALAVMPQEQV